MNIELGKTYRNGYGSRIRIIADDREDPDGFRFVGLLSTGGRKTRESVVSYNEYGEPNIPGSGERSILQPLPRYVNLDDALSLIRAKGFYDVVELDFIELLETMPFKELADA